MGQAGQVLPLLILLAASIARPAFAEDRMERARKEMVDEIVSMSAMVDVGAGRRQFSTPLLDVLRRLPRHRFVPGYLSGRAYDNRPLPIGHGQTISQPYIVALMTDLLELRSGQSALEIGTGSGYQAAVLAEMGAKVFSIEIIEPLAKEAASRLSSLGHSGVETKVGDGYHGWPERAPFDGIIVTAAASHIPPPLIRQLKAGGRMVIPVGAPFQTQQLLLIEKRKDESLITRQLMPVAFVPLTGGHD